jgi:hypothetical protein
MEHNRSEKFITDILKALKTIERLSDEMMDNDCDPEIINVFYVAAKELIYKTCPKEVFTLYPNLQDDEGFNEFLGHILNHCKEHDDRAECKA